MLRRIDLMPTITDLCFNVRQTSNLLIVLLNVLGLSNGDDIARGVFALSLERVDQVDHLFTYESVEKTVNLLAERKLVKPYSPVGAFVAFYELMSYLLVKKNTVNGKWHT